MPDEEGNLTIPEMCVRARDAVYAYRTWPLDTVDPERVDVETAIMDLIASLHHLHASLDEPENEWYTLVEQAEGHFQAEAYNLGPYADPPTSDEADYSPWFTIGQAVKYRRDGRDAVVAKEENEPDDHLVKLTFADGTSIWCPSFEVDGGTDDDPD